MKRPKERLNWDINTLRYVEELEELQAKVKELEEKNEKLRGLLQYVANEHLCGTILIEKMKEHGIEHEKPDKFKKGSKE